VFCRRPVAGRALHPSSVSLASPSAVTGPAGWHLKQPAAPGFGSATGYNPPAASASVFGVSAGWPGFAPKLRSVGE
jgi:hypothetical protein